MSREYIPAHVVNERERPRVLVWVSDTDAYTWIETLAGTYRSIRNLSEVDPDEWDALITDRATSTYRRGMYGDRTGGFYRRTPSNLFLFRVVTSEEREDLLDFYEEPGDEGPRSVLDWKTEIPGHKLRRIENLPEDIQDLVKRSLVPAAEARDKQRGVVQVPQPPARPLGIRNFRPFLMGPQDIALAASYERVDGVQGWVVPADAQPLKSWFEIALADWHSAKPEVFPGVGAWQEARDWMTNSERSLDDKLNDLDAEFREARETYEASRESIELAMTDARDRASAGRRLLLTGQDDDLQREVLAALVDLGLDVQDMDEIWPERERREDFRITDPDDRAWLAIADATGVQKGAKASKLQTVSNYVAKFLLEEKPATAPVPWVIVNRLLDRDPSLRGELFREDEVKAFAAGGGLAIDSVGLFVLREAIEERPSLKRGARALLRTSTGQLTLSDVRAWLQGA